MPNQRSKDKSFVGGYVRYKLRRKLIAIAEQEGKSQSELIEEFLKQGVERYSELHDRPRQDRPRQEGK